MAPNTRRGFLRNLAALPLIGGGVSLIGAPTAVAEPVTRDLLRTYGSWLHGERCRVLAELYPGQQGHFGLDVSNPGHWFHHPVPDYRNPPASTRAALVLSAVGCDWKGRQA